MSDILSAIASHLKSDTAVANLTEGRVYVDEMPQNAASPCVVARIISTDAQEALDGPLYFDASRIEFDCYGSNRQDAVATWKAVRAAVRTMSRKTTMGVMVREVSQSSGRADFTERPTLGTDEYRYGTTQDFSFWYCSN